MTEKTYITVSYAQSIDGNIATSSGDSQWISGPETLKLCHQLRRENQAILIGIGTVLRDDPILTCRLVRGNSPARIVLDSHLRIPHNSRIAESARELPTYIFTSEEGYKDRKREEIEGLGLNVKPIPASESGGLSPEWVVKTVEDMGMNRILIEGGGRVITSFLRAGLVNRMIIVTAPIFIGKGIPAIADLGVESLKDVLSPRKTRFWCMGRDAVWDIRF